MFKPDPEILENILEWGRNVEGFNRTHATDGLTCVQGYLDGVVHEDGRSVPGLGSTDRHGFYLFALGLAWIFWLDDCFDAHILGGDAPVDVDALIDASTNEPTTPEARGYYLLRMDLSKRARSPEDVSLWISTSERFFRSWSEEELLSSKKRVMSYAEYIENGVHSSTVAQILATASLVYGLGMPSRLGDPIFDRYIRNLSIICRLHNDYHSVDKERREGCGANAVLLMESYMESSVASKFVREELDAYIRMLHEDIEIMGVDDPFGRLAKAMIASHERLYHLPRVRYLTA